MIIWLTLFSNETSFDPIKCIATFILPNHFVSMIICLKILAVTCQVDPIKHTCSWLEHGATILLMFKDACAATSNTVHLYMAGTVYLIVRWNDLPSIVFQTYLIYFHYCFMSTSHADVHSLYS